MKKCKNRGTNAWLELFLIIAVNFIFKRLYFRLSIAVFEPLIVTNCFLLDKWEENRQMAVALVS